MELGSPPLQPAQLQPTQGPLEPTAREPRQRGELGARGVGGSAGGRGAGAEEGAEVVRLRAELCELKELLAAAGLARLLESDTALQMLMTGQRRGTCAGAGPGQGGGKQAAVFG